MTEIELVCVRHGQTAWNAELRFQGQSDVPLNEAGRAQARELALALREWTFALALSSDLVRASETAQTILRGREVPLRLDHDLREMNFGEWEGLTWAQILERNPALRVEYDVDHSPKRYAPPGGERFEDVIDRARRVLEKVGAQASEGTSVLIVTHAAVLHALVRLVLGPAAAARVDVRFRPAGVTRFAVEPGAGEGGGRLLALNQRAAECAGALPEAT
ncbi:MAG: histidine phosphatase family protein [Candidatus Eremiobacteraeota bacterium]|nr:histidine phosphatase family protein [Candidatus Eremiobacteraeota bacterium]MBV8355555.1 histidine phosphatase family protein [Candidatus Eremiobacteraeota bacterium]